MSPPDSPGDVEPLLDYLKRSRGFDFTAYKRTSLARRVQKRLQALERTSYADYIRYLDGNSEEFDRLFNTILINVTSFLRDPEAWDYLAQEILPRLVNDSPPEGNIRVWSAGCASGQEAFTVAMLLAERLGVERCRQRVKIYASDVDEEALAQARHATYSHQQVQEVPTAFLTRYFERVEDRYAFHRELRRIIIFGRHDLVQDAPISRVNLLLCRNTLMYFTRETQAKVLGRFHFGLRNGGYLFMGKAEMLLTHGDLFTPVDLKWRVFTRTPDRDLARDFPSPRREEAGSGMSIDNQIQALSIENDVVPKIVVQMDGSLALVNERARSMFRLSRQDVGRRLHDLELSYRPLELRSLIEEVAAHRRPVVRKDVSWSVEGEKPLYLEVQLTPLMDGVGRVEAIQVTFLDVSLHRRLQEELEKSKHELETAYEELQSSNEELETTNEELQSTNEELETTNEELQSTNEELETMNEELQSTNEELETINTEMRARGEELNLANAFLASILGGLEVGVVVVNPDSHVMAWNHRAEDLWGLRADEVMGRHLMNLDITLPVERLRQPVRSLIAGDTARVELSLDCLNRRGRAIRCAITGSPLAGNDGTIRGAILMMRDAPLPEGTEPASA